MLNRIRWTVLITAALLSPGVALAEEAGGQTRLNSIGRISVIPQPLRMESSDEWYALTADQPIYCDAGAKGIAHELAGYIESWLGKKPEVRRLTADSAKEHILLSLDAPADADLGDEGYMLTIDAQGIRMRAAANNGLFYALQTLRQIQGQGAPFSPDEDPPTALLRHVTIVDKPRYGWRGMHLDVSRHFMPLEFVKKYIDLLAYHKLNVFHWHLTDDQGWRIEIKKYPKLAEISAWRIDDGQRYGGYFSQDQVREVLDYAARRFVTVVPEIEMPGHTMAALAAYPELSCTGGPFEVSGSTGIREDVYCAGNDETFVFLENVLDEVCKLFPGPYIHIGGDECPKVRWEKCEKCQARIRSEGLADEHALQSYFIRRIEKVLNARGKRLIGWDEILEGGLAPNATVMSWRGTKGGVEAARMGHDVVMCPTSHCYFDYRQSAAPGERGPDWAPPLQLATAYAFEPTPAELSAAEARHVLGAQGNIWTERMLIPEHVEYMAFPRACALAEVVWSAPENRNWENFYERLQVHLKRLDDLGVKYRPLDAP